MLRVEGRRRSRAASMHLRGKDRGKISRVISLADCKSALSDCSTRPGHRECSLCSRASWEEKGGLGGKGVKRAAPTHSGRSLRPSTQEAAAIPFAHVVLDLRARGRRLASVRAKMGCAWCGLVRGKGGEGAAVGESRSSTTATAAAASGAGARLGGEATRGASERASCGGSGAGAAGFKSSRRRGGTGRAAGSTGAKCGWGEREWERKMHETLSGGLEQRLAS